MAAGPRRTAGAAASAGGQARRGRSRNVGEAGVDTLAQFQSQEADSGARATAVDTAAIAIAAGGGAGEEAPRSVRFPGKLPITPAGADDEARSAISRPSRSTRSSKSTSALNELRRVQELEELRTQLQRAQEDARAAQERERVAVARAHEDAEKQRRHAEQLQKLLDDEASRYEDSQVPIKDERRFSAGVHPGDKTHYYSPSAVFSPRQQEQVHKDDHDHDQLDRLPAFPQEFFVKPRRQELPAQRGTQAAVASRTEAT